MAPAPMSGERGERRNDVIDESGRETGIQLRPIQNGVVVSLEQSELLPMDPSLESPVRGSGKRDYDPERWKTLVAFLTICFSGFLNFFLLTIIHDVVPRNEPLPDLAFMLITQQPEWALPAGDVIAALAVGTTFLLIVFHKYRWVVFRRLFLLAGFLYGLRAFVMGVTFMPPSFKNQADICIAPAADGVQLKNILHRLGEYIRTMGLTSNEGKILCGDLMFSGHTIMLTLMYFTLIHYTPSRLSFLKWLCAPPIYFGMLTLILSGGHYTMDVLIAYWLSSHLYWSYHQIFEMKRSKRTDLPLTHLWWYWISDWFELNVPFHGKLPNELSWPLPWPEQCIEIIDNLSRKLNHSPGSSESRRRTPDEP